MKALITTNQLGPYAGSALVAIEVAQILQGFGYSVEICASYIASPLKEYIVKIGLKVVAVEQITSIDEFDIVWSQNHVLPTLLASATNGTSLPRIFSVCLSPYDQMEMPGAIADLSERVVANSYETADRLKELGVSPERIFVLHNAAPPSFSVPRRTPNELNRLLAVANHAPPEVDKALDILRNMGVNVHKIGFPAGQARITPEMICENDAVLTIGKTTQYALRSGTPVYIYDRFGGPGWLTTDNAERAAYFNFSGRCCRRKLDAHEIAAEVRDGFETACDDATHLLEAFGDRFDLVSQIRSLLDEPSQIRQQPPSVLDIVRREGILAKYANSMFASLLKNNIEIDTLRRKTHELENEVNSYKAEISGHGQAIMNFNDRICQLDTEKGQLLSALDEKKAATALHERKLASLCDELDNAVDEASELRRELSLIRSGKLYRLRSLFRQ